MLKPLQVQNAINGQIFLNQQYLGEKGLDYFNEPYEIAMGYHGNISTEFRLYQARHAKSILMTLRQLELVNENYYNVMTADLLEKIVELETLLEFEKEQ